MKRLTGREAVEMALALDTAAWFVLPGVWVETFDPLGNRVVRPVEAQGEPCHRPYDGRLDAHLKYVWLDLFRVGISGQRLRDILDMPDGALSVRTLEGIDESGYSVRLTTEEYQAGQEKWRELVSHTTGKLPRREYAPGEYIQLELSGFYIDVPEQPQKEPPVCAASNKGGRKPLPFRQAIEHLFHSLVKSGEIDLLHPDSIDAFIERLRDSAKDTGKHADPFIAERIASVKKYTKGRGASWGIATRDHQKISASGTTHITPEKRKDRNDVSEILKDLRKRHHIS